MVLLYMKTGDCVEVEGAVSARRVDDDVICYDEDGFQVQRFPAVDVLAFTRNQTIATQMEDEVCDEVTVVPEKEERDRMSRS